MTGCAYYHQDQSTLPTKNNNTEINIKVENLEKLVQEMAEKIVTLESKVKEIELKEVIIEKEDVKNVDDAKKVTNKKDKSKDHKNKKAKDKDSVFMFGAEARKTVSERKKSEVAEKLVKKFQCEHCNYSCEKLSILKKDIQSRHTMQ